MKQFTNATNIIVDNHTIIKNGYIQLINPIKVTDSWLAEESVIEGFDTNLDSIIDPLRENKIIASDLDEFIGKTIYCIPDESLYSAYLEMIRQDIIIKKGNLSDETIQNFLDKSDEIIDGLMTLYDTVIDLLIQRMWSFILLQRNQVNHKHMCIYENLYSVSALQALLIIHVNTPGFDLKKCFTEQSKKQ